MSGSNAIAQYLGRITQESDSGLNVSTALIIFGAVKFVVGVMSSMLIDRVGRRPLLIYSFFGAGVSLTIVGAYFFKQEVIGSGNQQSSFYGFIPFTGIIIHTIITTLGFGSVVYIIPAEIFPINVKSLAMSLCSILGGSCNFTLIKCYQQLKDLIGLCGAFGIFACVSFIGAVFSYIFVPETKGKSFREIQIELQGDIYDEAVQNLNQVVREDELAELTVSPLQRKDG